MAISFSNYCIGNRLQFASQFSNAVLINGFGHNCEGAFDYVRNVMTIPYQYGDPSERELENWKQNQVNHPSFQLSNAVFLPSTN